jgi:predicted nucleic acid-binding protein
VIVLDASVVVELVTNSPTAVAIRQDLAGRADRLIAPHLLDVEVLSAIRRQAAEGRIDASRSAELLADLTGLPATRQPHTDLLARIWELRHNFTAYDATYIALAEATDATLYTLDGKLSKGHRARVRVFSK